MVPILNVDDKSKNDRIDKGLRDGTYDVTDLQSTRNSLSDEGKQIMQSTLEVGEDEEGNLIAKSNVMSSIIEAKQAEQDIEEFLTKRKRWQKLNKFNRLAVGIVTCWSIY